VPAVRGVAADIELLAPREALALPEDLLAVLGWNWTRLLTPRGRSGSPGSWKSKLRLRGRLPARSAAAERALDHAAVHLAQTLAEPPAQFHQRHRLARLGVVARRVIPLATPLLLVATILLMPRLDIEQGMGLWWLLYHVPTVLIMLSFTLQELPTLALPPWPRPSRAPDWRAA
jgi:thiosulfate reductase cytochrome b subunit